MGRWRGAALMVLALGMCHGVGASMSATATAPEGLLVPDGPALSFEATVTLECNPEYWVDDIVIRTAYSSSMAGLYVGGEMDQNTTASDCVGQESIDILFPLQMNASRAALGEVPTGVTLRFQTDDGLVIGEEATSTEVPVEVAFRGGINVSLVPQSLEVDGDEAKVELDVTNTGNSRTAVVVEVEKSPWKRLKVVSEPMVLAAPIEEAPEPNGTATVHLDGVGGSGGTVTLTVRPASTREPGAGGTDGSGTAGAAGAAGAVARIVLDIPATKVAASLVEKAPGPGLPLLGAALVAIALVAPRGILQGSARAAALKRPGSSRRP